MRILWALAVLPWSICLCATVDAAQTTDVIQQFRGDATFWQRVRGFKDPKQPQPSPANLKGIVAAHHPVHRQYLAELYRGFIAEIAGDVALAEQHYKRCLAVPVHEEQSYYTHVDLARTALKRGAHRTAVDHLRRYLWYLSQEIKAGEGELTEVFFGYVPGPEALTSLKKEHSELQRVLAALEAS